MEITGKHLIGFDLAAQGSSTFQATNPGTGENIEYKFTEATAEDVDQAVKKAEKAFRIFSKTSGEKRAEFLEQIGQEILNLGDDLIKICMQETALPEARLQGERMRTVNQLKLFAQVIREGSWIGARIDTAQPDRQPLPKPDLRQMKIALGPVGVFGASNFPLAFSVAGGDTASAFAAGCTVVVKAHQAHPGTSEMVGRAIIKAAKATGMPEGVFSLIQGEKTDAGMALVNHPLIKAIGFTGSLKGGRAIYDAAAKRAEPIPVYAEMGSFNPVFVLPGALKERGEKIAQGLAGSVTLGVGQFCTNPGVVVALESSETESFIKKTGEAISGVAPGYMLSDRIKIGYDHGVQTQSGTPGVEVVARVNSNGNKFTGAASLLKTSASVFIQNPELSEEVFGPSTLSVLANNKQELLDLAENLQGHLTATIHASENELEEYKDLIQVLERKVGRIIYNGFPTGVEVSHAMIHGGPYPATTDSKTTSVGTAAIERFCRPVCFQDFPQKALPEALLDENPLGIWRMVNGDLSKEKI